MTLLKRLCFCMKHTTSKATEPIKFLYFRETSHKFREMFLAITFLNLSLRVGLILHFLAPSNTKLQNVRGEAVGDNNVY